jgi:hypothetical protein
VKDIRDALLSLSDTAFMIIFAGVFLIASLTAYFLYNDTRLLEKKIAYKQKDLSLALDLRHQYETRKKSLDAPRPERKEGEGLSLASLEEMVAKNFTGGRLTTLKPTAPKADRGKVQTSMEVRVTGAPLGEVVNFLKAANASALSVRKLTLTVPPNQMTLEMQAVVTEGRGHE